MDQRQLTTNESKELARHIVDALVLKMTDEAVVNSMTIVWGRQLDQWIGKGIRRIAFYVLMGAMAAGAVKFHIWDLMFK